MGLFGKNGTMSSPGQNKMNDGAADLERDPINKAVMNAGSAIMNLVNPKPTPSPSPKVSPIPKPDEPGTVRYDNSNGTSYILKPQKPK